MGRAVFSSEAEKKFLELWSDALRDFDKTMTSRAEKVAYVTKRLNSYINWLYRGVFGRTGEPQGGHKQSQRS